MVLTLMLELMVPTTLARGLLMLSLRPRLMLSLRPRLMLLSSTELMDMPVMLLPLTPMDMLHMPDTPMLLDMLVLMVATTLARGLLKLSLKLMLMLSMVPMDILHMVLRLMPILDTVDILDTVHMLDTHTLMVPTPPTVLIPSMDKKETLLDS